MFGLTGALHSLVGSVKVEENNGIITLYGFNGRELTAQMFKVWRSNKIGNKMFTKIGKTEVSFRRFFLMDVVYVLETLMKANYVRINRRALAKAIEELKTQTSLAWVFDEETRPGPLDFSRLKDLSLVPRPHQQEYMDEYNQAVPRYGLRGHLASLGVGQGKTYLSLSLMHCAKVDTVIVFSPNNAVQRVWRDTLTWSHKEPVKFWDSHMQGPPPLGMSHYVIHYEYMGKFYEWLKVNYKSLGVVGIVIDECHNFNEIKSARTQLLVDIAKLTNSQHTLWMSGTPLKAMGKETIPLLRTIDPLFDAKTEKDYLDIFGQASDRALDILANRIGKISYKVDTNSVLTDIQLKKWVCNVKLPNGIDYTLDEIRKKLEAFVKERTEYYKQHEEEFKRDYLNGISYFRDCIASDEQELIRLNQYEVDVKDVRKGYDPIKHKEIVPQLNKYEKDVIMPLLPKHIKDPFKKAKSVYKYVQLTIMGEALGSVLGKARTQCNVDIANALDQVELHSSDGKLKVQTSLKEIIDNAEKKSILFTSFIEVLKASSAKLATQGFKPLEVYGETNSNLPQIVQKFAKDEDANPLIATYQSLSTAVPLTMANNLVMLNAPFREHEYRQAYGRCYRMGQDKDVTVIDVFLDTGNLPNISTRSKDIMDTTAKQVAIMLGIEKIDLTVATEAIEETIPEWLTTNRVDEVKDRVKLSNW